MKLDVYRPARSSWSLGVQSPPEEPVDAVFVRDHLNLVDVDALTLLDAYITQAREIVELETNRVLLSTACTLRLDRFPLIEDAVIELPGGHVQSIDAISYLDRNGVEQAWSSDEWIADLADTFGNGRLGLAYGAAWPEVLPRGLAVTIEYTAGWADPASVPAALKGAVAKVAASLYDERHAHSSGQITSSPWFRAMISRWRVYRVA